MVLKNRHHVHVQSVRQTAVKEFYITKTMHWHESYIKNQPHAHFTYIKMFKI
jgi:hypothetical protein